MVTVTVIEDFKFRIESRGHEIVVDQPKEDGGSDSGMMPLELLEASLASCVTYMVVEYCRRHSISTSDLKVKLDRAIVEGPHRIGAFDIKIESRQPFNGREKKVLLRMAQACTVHNTLTNPPEINVTLA